MDRITLSGIKKFHLFPVVLVAEDIAPKIVSTDTHLHERKFINLFYSNSQILFQWLQELYSTYLSMCGLPHQQHSLPTLHLPAQSLKESQATLMNQVSSCFQPSSCVPWEEVPEELIGSAGHSRSLKEN
jgi:hypothetical protein